MALVNKQDSNFTELRYAVEQAPGVLPASPTWHPVEPNEYDDFGGSVVTKARRPINSSRQRKKGVVVDLDAKAGFTQDITATNSQDFMSSFFFAAIRQKTNSAVASIASGDYVVASGGDAYEAGDLIVGEDFVLNANNGLKKVAAGATSTSVPTVESLTDATGQSGTITRVGVEFGSGAASINATASEFPRLELSGNVAATGTLTLTGNAVADDTVTIGSQTYTFKAALTPAANEVLIGASASDSIDNLVAAINKAAGGGTVYASATVANADVTAAAGAGDTMDVTAKVKGASGNLVATTEVLTNGSWGAATLSGGTGRAATSLGLIPGEFVFIGSEVTDTSFASDECNGFCRVRAVESDAITFDKTQFVMVDDAGTAKTIRLFFGHVLKNEADKALVIKRTLQMERSLGAPDDALPAQVQGEYVTRCMADECTIDAKTADIMTLKAAFLGGTHETRTGAQGLKDGDRPAIVESDAFNTTSDVSLIKMAVVTDGDSCPAPLFAYLTDLTMTVKNNLKQNKAISVLGAFDVSPGMFEVSAQVTAYFQTVESISLVQSNVSVTLESHFVKANKGITYDLPLITLSKSMAEVKSDEPVMLPLESDAATAALIHPDLDYTTLLVFWPYLPDTAQ